MWHDCSLYQDSVPCAMNRDLGSKFKVTEMIYSKFLVNVKSDLLFVLKGLAIRGHKCFTNASCL